MKKYSFPFVETKCLVPFLKFSDNEGKDVFVLLDTGAESTFFDISLKENHPGLVSPLSVIGEMNVMSFSGETDITVKEGDICLPFEAMDGNEGKLCFRGSEKDLSSLSDHVKKVYGYPDEFSIILGGRTLRDLRARIDYVKKMVTFSVKESKKK